MVLVYLKFGPMRARASYCAALPATAALSRRSLQGWPHNASTIAVIYRVSYTPYNCYANHSVVQSSVGYCTNAGGFAAVAVQPIYMYTVDIYIGASV